MQSQLEATQRQPGVAQSQRGPALGDAEAPEVDAKPREAGAGPERLTHTLEADAERFRGVDWG